MIRNQVNILVIYDISDTRKRNKLVRLLNSYGVRVQKSAYEIVIDKNGLNKLVNDIKRLIDEKCDSVRFYEVLDNKYKIQFGVQLEENVDINAVYVL